MSKSSCKLQTAFVKQYSPVVVRYDQLDLVSRYAMAWYMAVDGEAWDLPTALRLCTRRTHEQERVYKRKFLRQDAWFMRHYGHEKFGTVTLPMDELCREIFERTPDIRSDFRTFKEYCKWYECMNLTKSDRRHRTVWPVILSSTDDDVLQDGWHRFHVYRIQGREHVPALFYTGAHGLPFKR